jgi:hypothetical protein
MSPDPSLFHMYCVDAREHFLELESETWKQTGRVRWHSLTTGIDWSQAVKDSIHVYAFLWPDGPLKSSVATRIGPLGLGKVTWVEGVTSRVLHRNGKLKGLTDTVPFDTTQLVKDLLVRHKISRFGPKAAWDPHDQQSRLAKVRFTHEAIDLDLVLEKYFPGKSIQADVRSAGGGWSGSPLLSVHIDGKNYFLKFFDSVPFRDEWRAHERAKDQWLKNLAVEIVRIPDLAADSDESFAHSIAFSGQRHAICYLQARSTKRLDEIYADFPDSANRAYRKVVEALQSGNENPILSSLELHRLPDIGPPFETSPSASLLDAIRSDAGMAPIEANLARLGRFGRALFPSQWSEVDSALLKFLSNQLPKSLQYACQCTLGHVHCDANSRNFLFDGTTLEAPDGLQIVDCGGYKEFAPLVFDLAQLEADLKFVLMGSEKDSGYDEINPAVLKSKWVVEEERAITNGLQYSGPAITSTPLSRCYGIVSLIRKRAFSISTNDEYGRAYFYCLLYWTLRKTRQPGRIHSVKSMLAFYSAWLILKRLNCWTPA